MRPGEEHVIPCVDNKHDTMIVSLDSDGELCIQLNNDSSTRRASHYLNHDTARQLFALLGNYLHSWPAP